MENLTDYLDGGSVRSDGKDNAAVVRESGVGAWLSLTTLPLFLLQFASFFRKYPLFIIKIDCNSQPPHNFGFFITRGNKDYVGVTNVKFLQVLNG